MPISRYRFQIMCKLSRQILLLVIATMRGTEPTGPLECRLAEWSKDWSCSLEPNLLRVVTTSEWIASNDLFDFHLAWWSMIEAIFVTRAHFEWLQSRERSTAYSNSDLTRWSADLWASFSSQFFKKTKRECCWRLMTDHSKLKNFGLWYQMLEMEVLSAEVATLNLLWRA